MQKQSRHNSRWFVTFLAALMLATQALAADKFDFSGFDAGEQFVAQSAVRRLEVHEDCYAYVTVNQLGLDVLRLSNKPLGRPNGNHLLVHWLRFGFLRESWAPREKCGHRRSM